MAYNINYEGMVSDLRNKKRIVLFTGAGINYSPDIELSWNAVTRRFIDYALPLLNFTSEDVEELRNTLICHPQADSFSPELQVGIVKSLLGETYVNLLQEILYSQCNHDVLAKACKDYVARGRNTNVPFFSLFSIAEFILRHENIHAVVTYNFDNFLREAIVLLQHSDGYLSSPRADAEYFRPVDAYSGGITEPFDEHTFMIYHIHGYVQPPEEPRPDSRNNVVLSIDEYFDKERNCYSWQNATQIHFLSHYTCIYLGISLNDRSMLQILRYAELKYNQEKVYFVSTDNTAVEHLRNAYFTSAHLTVVPVESYGTFYNSLLKL